MIKNVRGGVLGVSQVDGYLFTFHMHGRAWQDLFYRDLILVLMNHATEYIIKHGVEVYKIDVGISVSPKTIIKQIVVPDFYWIGNQRNWNLLAKMPDGKVLT